MHEIHTCIPWRYLHGQAASSLCASGGEAKTAGREESTLSRVRRSHDEVCFFLVRLTLSRFRTCSSVCELSIILEYAASVSWIVLSYSFLDATFLAKLSFILASLSVRIRRSFWIFACGHTRRDYAGVVSTGLHIGQHVHSRTAM